jgi:outer membrane receptor protein involved in Fe transport
MSHWHVRPVLVALGLVVAGSAAAQVPDSTRADSVPILPPIEVVGTILPFAGPNVSSGIPARSASLDWTQIDATEPRQLPDVLQQLPGFNTYDDLGSAYKFNVQSRGFYSSPVVGLPQGLSVFVDGVRMNEPDAAEVNFDLLPLEHVKRVEVLSGNGTLLGRNSLGGAINLVTRRGELGSLNGEVEATGGSYGAASIEGGLGKVTKNGLDYYVGGGYNREDGWRQKTKADQYQGFVNLGKLGQTSGIRLQSFYSHSYAQTAGSLPESVYLVNPDSNLSANDYEDLNSFQASLLGYKQIGSGRGSFNIYYRNTKADRFNANQEDDPDTYGESRIGVFGGTADYRFVVPVTGASSLGLRFGADGSTSSTSVALYADSTKFGGGMLQTTDVDSPVWDLAGFALADFNVGRVTFSGGFRYDYVKAPFYNRLDSDRDTTQVFQRFNPRFGVDVNAGGGFSVFGSVGTGFRAPAVIEIACADPEEPCPLPFALGDDPPIKPVTTTSYEVGARYLKGRIALDASMYRTDVKNDIYLFPSEDEVAGSTIEGYFGNIDKTRREGLEASARYYLGQHYFYANYAWTRATFQSEAEIFSIREEFDEENEVEPGDKLPLVPEHQVKAGVSLRFPVGFRGGADVRYIGQQWLRGDEANVTTPLDGYFVADARVGWEWNGWEIAGIVTNLFNKKYASFGTFNINQGGGDVLERFLTPGQVRQFRVVVTREFGVDRD